MERQSVTRSLIVNADDFGQSAGVNRGVIEAHEHGIVTSASLMVCWPAAAEAASYARANTALSVGLHIDLGEWICRNGEWIAAYQVVLIDEAPAVAAEVERQVQLFRQLVGRDPSHLDSHQHVHRDPPARDVVVDWGRRLGVPVRHFAPHVRYCGAFYGQSRGGESCLDSITPETLIALIRGLPPGTTELACHPARGTDLDSMYCRERPLEFEALCDPRVRAAIAAEKIELRSFRDGVGQTFVGSNER
jgi:chitin disaccharide deacetylase